MAIICNFKAFCLLICCAITQKTGKNQQKWYVIQNHASKKFEDYSA